MQARGYDADGLFPPGLSTASQVAPSRIVLSSTSLADPPSRQGPRRGVVVQLQLPTTGLVRQRKAMVSIIEAFCPNLSWPPVCLAGRAWLVSVVLRGKAEADVLILVPHPPSCRRGAEGYQFFSVSFAIPRPPLAADHGLELCHGRSGSRLLTHSSLALYSLTVSPQRRPSG
jgi:hypothetical protein